MSGVLIAIIAIVLILFLLWAIFLSGWVIDRNPDVQETNIQQNEGDETDVNVPSDTDQQTPTAPTEEPSPASSP